jgi:uncharacterized spore protein YtfJ
VAKVTISGGGGAGGGTAGHKDRRPKFVPLGGGGGLSMEVTPMGFICERGDDVVFHALERDDEGVLDRMEHLVEAALQRRKP